MSAGTTPAATQWFPSTTSPRVLTVVGGSSPFTLALALALAEDPPWALGTLRLQGRDRTALAAVAGCASHLLAGCGWRVDVCPDLPAALTGADVVVHQNRYGGLAWRTEDELLVDGLGLAPDETLGPGGLSAALRTGHGQRCYAAAFAQHAPGRPVLMMTNPLGVSTALMAAAGVPVLGVCELPEMTRLDVAAALDVPPLALHGSYDGHNHRGFWHHLTVDGRDVLPDLVERLGSGRGRLSGAGPDVVAGLDAVPDKYHALLTLGHFLPPGRAAALDGLRSRIQGEAAARPEVVPPSLAGREMPWYRLVVVPVLAALAGRPTRVVVTVPGDGPTTPAAEHLVDLEGGRLAPVEGEPAPGPVAAWQRRFREHETAVLAAADEPSYGAVLAALALDPVVPTERVPAASRATWDAFGRWVDGGA